MSWMFLKGLFPVGETGLRRKRDPPGVMALGDDASGVVGFVAGLRLVRVMVRELDMIISRL